MASTDEPVCPGALRPNQFNSYPIIYKSPFDRHVAMLGHGRTDLDRVESPDMAVLEALCAD